ncbi:MAG: hypothetical protein ACLTKQ_02605 [Acutalibacteraceae bacterium]
MPAVKLNSAKSDYYAFKVNYNRNSSVTGYKICYATNSNFKSSKTITKKNTKTKAKTYSTTVKNLSGAKKYYVRVRTYKTVKVGKKKVTYYSNWSAAKTVTTKKVTPAAAPTGFKLSAPKYKKLKGSWNKVSGASGYQLQYSRDSDYTGSQKDKDLTTWYMNNFLANPDKNDSYAGIITTSNLSCTAASLKGGTKYTARVRSYRTVNGKRVCVKRSAINHNCDENAGGLIF